MIEQIKLGLSSTANILKFIMRFPTLLMYMLILGIIRTQVFHHIPYDYILVHLLGDVLFLWFACALLYRTESILLRQPISVFKALTLPLKNIFYIIAYGLAVGLISILLLKALASFNSLIAQETVNFILLESTTLILACIAIIMTFESNDMHNVITKTIKIISWKPIALLSSFALLTLSSFFVMLLMVLLAIIVDSTNMSQIFSYRIGIIVTVVTMLLTIAIIQTSIVLLCLYFYHDRRRTEQEEMMIDIRSAWMQ
jgi:hypothetical protein